MRNKIIQCHCLPASGHAIPMLRIIQILQESNPEYAISFISSRFFVERMQKEFPHIAMVSVEDDLSQSDFIQLKIKYGMKLLSKLFFKMHKLYFENKQDHPDLLICDIFSEQALRYAKKNNITCIINNIFPYHIFQEVYNLQKLERSFGFAGFTVMYPHIVNIFCVFMGLSSIYEVFRHQHKVLVNSAIGLEHATTVPTHHIFLGILAGRHKKTKPLSKELMEWMKGWKTKGKEKFIYISFGTEVDLSENFVLRIQEAVEKAAVPAIWSLKEDFGKFSSPLIFNRTWLPQQSILALHEVKAFISHCGWGSICEAVATQTPLLGIPCFGDQIHNATLIHSKKIGLKIYQSLVLAAVAPKYFNPWISVTKISESIAEMVEKDSYRQNIQKVRKVCESYRTWEIVRQSVASSLEFGHSYLIDQGYEKAAKRSTTDTVKLLLVVVVAVLFWRHWDSFFG